MPGLVRHHYDNAYWPLQFESIHDNDILNWLEEHLFMVLLWPRKKGLDLLQNTNINTENVRQLSQAADEVWKAIQQKDLEHFAKSFLDSFNAQTKMFPNMLNEEIQKVIDSYKQDALAWKLAGAGGGGYLILLAEKPVKDAMRIKIRRKEIGI
jgi:galactokinase/mevalonate kinase-like predicted kinase